MPRSAERSGGRSWRLQFAVAVGLAGTACEDPGFIPIPEVPGAATVAFFLLSPGSLRVFVHPAEAPGPIEAPLGARDTLVLGFYERTLAELELEPGPVDAAPADACLTGDLGAALALYGTPIADPELVELESPPDMVRAFRFERRCPCDESPLQVRSLPGNFPIASLAPAGPRSIFYLVFERWLVEHDLDTGFESRIELAPDASFKLLCTADRETVYLAGTGGEFARYRRSVGRIEPLSPFPATDVTFAQGLACRGRSGGEEVLLLRSPESDLLRWDGAEWTTVRERSEARGRTANRGSLLVRRDEGVVFAPEDGLEIVELDAELRWLRTSPWDRDLDSSTGPLGWLADSEALDLGLLTRSSRLLHRPSAGSEWQPILGDAEALPFTSTALFPFRAGLLVIGQGGLMSEVHPIAGRCPPRTSLDHLHLDRAAVFPESGRLVLTSNRDFEGDNALVILDPGP